MRLAQPVTLEQEGKREVRGLTRRRRRGEC
jgi:hypothetical protein